MRTLSPALAAAVATLGSQPDVALELADIAPHWTTVVSGAAPGKCDAAIAPDGSVIFASIAGSGPWSLAVQRSTSPATSWPGFTTVSTDANILGGVCVAVAGSTVRLLWQSAASSAVLHTDSSDNGQTWSAPATLFTPGHTVYGIGCAGDLNTVVIAYDVLGLGSQRLSLWRFSGAWSGTDWTDGDLVAISGVAIVPNQVAAGQYFVVVAFQGTPGEPYSLRTCALNPSGTPMFSALTLVLPVDTSVGVYLAFPHLGYFDGLYRLSFVMGDTGSSSGVVYSRCARSVSPDFQHWTAPVEDSVAQTGGAAWVKHASGQLLCGAVVRFAPAYNPAVNYRDCSADLVKLDVTEKEGQPAKLVVTLDNTSGQYTSLASLVVNAQLQLSQGYVGAGRIATHLFYVDEWTFVRAADVSQVVIAASDRAVFMERESRRPATYTNDAVGYVAADLAALGGFASVTVVDSQTQMVEQLPSFAVQQGESYLKALGRVLGVYDGTFRVECRPGSGVAFASVEQLHIIGKAVGDAVGYTYHDEPEVLHVTHSGDRANHVVVYGPLTLPAAFSDNWDWADVNVTGQERLAVAVETLTNSAAEAGVRGTLELAREQRFALAVQATVQPNPALELVDVVEFDDAVLGATVCRVSELHLTYYPLEGHFDLVIVGGGR